MSFHLNYPAQHLGNVTRPSNLYVSQVTLYMEILNKCLSIKVLRTVIQVKKPSAACELAQGLEVRGRWALTFGHLMLLQYFHNYEHLSHASSSASGRGSRILSASRNYRNVLLSFPIKK